MIEHKVFTEPLPLRSTRERGLVIDPEFFDWTGYRFKDITVIGLIDNAHSRGTNASWLCRCVCGLYLTRKHKSLRRMAENANSPRYCCDVCHERWNPFI